MSGLLHWQRLDIELKLLAVLLVVVDDFPHASQVFVRQLLYHLTWIMDTVVPRLRFSCMVIGVSLRLLATRFFFFMAGSVR